MSRWPAVPDDVPTVPPAGTVRLLLLGDSHGETRMVRRALWVAQHLGATALWSVGDFGIWPGGAGRNFLDACESMAAARAIPIRIVPGNHDDYDQIEAVGYHDGWAPLREHVWVAERGQVVTVGGCRLLAFGGAASIDGPDGVWPQSRGPGDGWWPQERISAADVSRAQARVAAAGGQVEVAVTHDVPAGVLMSGGDVFGVGELQRDRIAEAVLPASPQVVVSGHWHRFSRRPLGEATELVVLSADIAPREPQYLLLDLHPDRRVDVHIPLPWGQEETLTPERWLHGRPAAPDTDHDRSRHRSRVAHPAESLLP